MSYEQLKETLIFVGLFGFAVAGAAVGITALFLFALTTPLGQ